MTPIKKVEAGGAVSFSSLLPTVHNTFSVGLLPACTVEPAACPAGGPGAARDTPVRTARAGHGRRTPWRGGRGIPGYWGTAPAAARLGSTALYSGTKGGYQVVIDV